jgi:hypothetical protein
MRGLTLAAVVAVSLYAPGPRAFAGDYDLKGSVKVPANSRVVVSVQFTGGVDGNGDPIILQAGDLEFINGTNDDMVQEYNATAPAGTRDRNVKRGQKPFPPPVPPAADPVIEQGAAILPPLTPNMGDWLTANGFTSPETFDTPILFGDFNTNGVFDGSDVALYAENFDLALYKPHAEAANFPIGTQLAVPVGGLLYPGFRVYTDEELTTAYSGPAAVSGTISESVPEPGGAIVAAGLAAAMSCWRRRTRAAHAPAGADRPPS